jgi:hypothetical protein
MRRLVRTVVATATIAGALFLTAPASPAGAEGECVELYVDVTNPSTGTTACTPGI